MRLKTFTAENMSAAMKLIRDALGADAIIVSSHETAVGGVEVVAAVDPVDDSVVNATETFAGEAPVDVLDTLQDILDYHRVPARLIDRLYGAARALETDDATLALAGALDAQFAFAPLATAHDVRPVMLIGLPGAGKTVTIAKLATRARLARRNAALITTDTLRTGATEQFAGYAALLGISPRVAEGTGALQDAVAAARNAALKLIDTTGANPFDAGDMSRLRGFIAGTGAEPVLVLPAGMDSDEAADTAAAFAAIGATRLIATRLDTARRLGSLLAAAEAANLRLCDVGIGPHLADGLCPLNPLALARVLAAAPADRLAALAKAEPLSFAESLP